MSAPAPHATRCPRCGETVDVPLTIRPLFAHEADGSSYVTARVSAGKVEHACRAAARSIEGL